MPPASLITLPDEILLMICEELCYHCSGVHPPSNEKKSNTGLCSLIRTCRRLLDIAQPFLYHRVEIRKILLFLRTIIARQDLAIHVLSFNYSEKYPLEVSAEDLEMLQAELRRLNIGKCDEWVQEMNMCELDIDEQLLKLTLSHLPNVRKLSTSAPFCGTRTPLKDSLNKALVMDSIKVLRLIPLDIADLSDMGRLIVMTPHAESLMIYSCGLVTRRIPMARIRSIILFDSLIDATSLWRLIDSCPELEHFEYYAKCCEEGSYGYSVPFTWGQAQRALCSRRNTLKRLNLVFSKDYPLYLHEMEPEDYLGSLRDLDKLEALWVQTTSFGTDEDDATVPIFPADVDDLVKMLPESLTCLGFCGSHNNWDGIEILAEAIDEGHFPRLEVVWVEQEGEIFEDSCDILASVGVVCPPLGLMEMPNEILLKICKKLCSHCSGFPITFEKDLSSLSMTSKHLRAIALPVLHHDASPRKLRSFLRTITEQPDLAAQVHRFCNSGGDYYSLETEVIDYMNSTIGLMDTCKMLNDIISSHYQLLETTLAKLTEVKHLIITLPFYDGDESNDSLKVSFPMESVTRLSLMPWSGLDLGQMGEFLAMMPCLETLEVRDCINVTQQLPLASLRSLTFNNSEMEEKSLQNIVDSCPKLEYFDSGSAWMYSISRLEDGSEPLTWSQAQRTLRSRRETLKHLRLEFSPSFGISLQTLGQEEYFSSFCEFDALESLWVQAIGFGSENDHGTFPTFPENVQHVVRMLPRSLTYIYFSGCHKEWNGIQVMARAIQEGYFPRLKRVVVEACYPPITDVLPYCEELSATLGVCFEILDDEKMETKWKQHITAAYPWKG
ncbi:hypothetical protein CFAM422_004795 [Trichoderma lentiforme]|uniref:Uncharacterized protein n=1 Tax=Trichoderma lentiforme TaxID=1567552 RepID=A0A9P5CCK7_9HYPO|nr:hypothetical protein CFAM422_004795 [Trichoderma lentiforme]